MSCEETKNKLIVKDAQFVSFLWRSSGQEPARGPGSSRRWARHVLGCLSKQIKGVRALKDDGGCFYVLPQAAVAPIGLEEWVMGLKHSACSQMQGTRYRTSKHSVIYILVIHCHFFNEHNSTNKLLQELFRKCRRLLATRSFLISGRFLRLLLKHMVGIRRPTSSTSIS